jgi:hypothetical protein
MKAVTITSLTDLDTLKAKIIMSAEKSRSRLEVLLKENAAIPFLEKIKFEKIGYDPIDSNRELNFIEQLNQSFTYLATIEGTRHLLESHPNATPFHLNLGTEPGPDIISRDQTVVAEVFAATNPNSNNKLKRDIERVLTYQARYKYIFYISLISAKDTHPEIEIIQISEKH